MVPSHDFRRMTLETVAPSQLEHKYQEAVDDILAKTIQQAYIDACKLVFETYPRTKDLLLSAGKAKFIYLSKHPQLGVGNLTDFKKAPNIYGSVLTHIKSMFMIDNPPPSKSTAKYSDEDLYFMFLVERGLTMALRYGNLDEYIGPAQRDGYPGILDLLYHKFTKNAIKTIDASTAIMMQEKRDVQIENPVHLIRLIRRNNIRKVAKENLDELKQQAFNIWVQRFTMSQGYDADYVMRQLEDVSLADMVELRDRLWSLYEVNGLDQPTRDAIAAIQQKTYIPTEDYIVKCETDRIPIPVSIENEASLQQPVEMPDEVYLYPSKTDALIRGIPHSKYDELSPIVKRPIVADELTFPTATHYVIYKCAQLVPGMSKPKDAYAVLVDPSGKLYDIEDAIANYGKVKAQYEDDAIYFYMKKAIEIKFNSWWMRDLLFAIKPYFIFSKERLSSAPFLNKMRLTVAPDTTLFKRLEIDKTLAIIIAEKLSLLCHLLLTVQKYSSQDLSFAFVKEVVDTFYGPNALTLDEKHWLNLPDFAITAVHRVFNIKKREIGLTSKSLSSKTVRYLFNTIMAQIYRFSSMIQPFITVGDQISMALLKNALIHSQWLMFGSKINIRYNISDKITPLEKVNCSAILGVIEYLKKLFPDLILDKSCLTCISLLLYNTKTVGNFKYVLEDTEQDFVQEPSSAKTEDRSIAAMINELIPKFDDTSSFGRVDSYEGSFIGSSAFYEEFTQPQTVRQHLDNILSRQPDASYNELMTIAKSIRPSLLRNYFAYN